MVVSRIGQELHRSATRHYAGYRVRLGIDAGNQRWSLDIATWKGEVDGRRTNSATLRFLTPLGKVGDVEFGLGVDKSRDFESVTLFSVFFYFYG